MLAEVSRKNDRSRAFSAESHTYFSKHPVLRIVRNHRESYPVRPSRRSDSDICARLCDVTFQVTMKGRSRRRIPDSPERSSQSA
jgi:hypothetical protein